MHRIRLRFGIFLILLSVALAWSSSALGAFPSPPDSGQNGRAQSMPDWLPAESAGQLAVGIDVLVPWSLPAPFSGAPQISANSGYYSLYWFVGGGTPTLLQIIGTAGGTIPAYSKYDRNVQLEANASVNGYTAYHDVTPIYDLVYWQVGNVVYSVESQNSSVDSISVASSLTVLQVPEADPPAVTGSLTSPDQVTEGEIANVNVSVSGDATLTTDVGVFTANGGASIGVSGNTLVEWQAPALDQTVTATFQLLNGADGSVVDSTPTQILAQTDETSANNETEFEWGLTCPTLVQTGTTVTVTAAGSEQATLSASAGTFAGGSPAIVIDLAGSIDIEYAAPSDVGNPVLLTLASGEQAVATCEFALTDEEVTEAEPTELPDGTFNGDGTDLSVGTGKEPALPEGFGSPVAVTPIDPESHPGDGTGITEANQVTAPTVPATPSPTPTLRPGEPTLTPVPTDTPAPTLTPTAENPIPTMVPQVTNNGNLFAKEIGPQGGELATDFGIAIAVPEGTFQDMTSVTLQPVADNQVPLQSGLSLVPDSAYDISFAHLNGRAVELEDGAATVRMDLGERWQDNATLYQLVNGQAMPLDNVQATGSVLEIEIDGPMRLVAGVPTTVAGSSDRGLVPFIILALVAVIVLVVAGSVLTSLRGRRPRTVPTRRASGNRGRF